MPNSARRAAVLLTTALAAWSVLAVASPVQAVLAGDGIGWDAPPKRTVQAGEGIGWDAPLKSGRA
ncbi:hypothetical protein GCM10020229_66470 [Kitasatospora albolonga]|uniref:hypothetical protein n=1 Tax=Kitasatospora albolonga TaxID=68173 RepID=UPI0031E69623